MPGSWPYLRSDITKYLTSNFPSTSKILDIGAGEGTYYDLLKHHFNDFDGIEIFEPYIEKYDLKNKYNNLYLGNIVDFEFPDFDYDIIIMGDTLEHLSETDARTVINKYINRVNELIYKKISDSLNIRFICLIIKNSSLLGVVLKIRSDQFSN